MKKKIQKSTAFVNNGFSLINFAVFILIFGGIGTYILFHSSAAGNLNTTDAYKKVIVGSGFVENSDHQIMRTPSTQANNSDRVYVLRVNDGTDESMHMSKGNQSGIPTAFSEVDSTHRPTSSNGLLGSPDVRLDKNGIAHIVYPETGNTKLWYVTFNTNTDAWGTPVQIASNIAVLGSFYARTGNCALILDNNEIPHVVYTSTANTVVYLNRIGGAWSSPQTIYTGTKPIHPGLAADNAGNFYLAFANNTSAFNTGNQNRASPAATIQYMKRSISGTWSSAELVSGGSDTSVDNNVYLDQGPSIIVTTSGTPYVAYIGSDEKPRLRYRDSGGTWTADQPSWSAFPSTGVHDPIVHSEGDDLYNIMGHDGNIHYGYFYKISGQSWSSYQLMDSTQNDGTANTRWDPVRQTNPNVIDTIYMNEVTPTVYYMAFLPSGQAVTPPPPPPPPASDTTPPSVTMIQPANGSTVSGITVQVYASASDDVAVAGVQFKLDGVNIGAEDTTSQYTFNWDSTTVSNGSHTFTAVARDTSGNSATATTVTFTVNNAVTYKTGDINRDGNVDIFDLSTLLSNYNGTATSCDLNTDGIVSIFDLSILLSNYGT